jgi:hypothetical protein
MINRSVAISENIRGFFSIHIYFEFRAKTSKDKIIRNKSQDTINIHIKFSVGSQLLGKTEFSKLPALFINYSFPFLTNLFSKSFILAACIISSSFSPFRTRIKEFLHYWFRLKIWEE